MTFKKRCKCGAAAIIAFAASLCVAYVNGYSLGNWGASAWVGAVFIAAAGGICLRCRLREDEAEEAAGQ